MFMIPNMINCTHFLIFVSEFNPDFEDKCFMNYVTNQVIRIFCFKLNLNNTHVNINFESSEFRPTKLTLNVYINIF